jgi:acyl-CoA synthetase (NDP forming)
VEETTIGNVIAGAAAAGRSALSEIESKRVLDAIGVATAMPEHAASAEEAAAAAARVGFPAVLKVLSPEITHKSEVGGVALGLRSEAEAREAFERIRRTLAERAPHARFEGVAVQAMAPAGVELIAGITRDDRFGPIIVAGLGGIFVEVLEDIAFRLAPISRGEARAMIDELRGAAILRGLRGAPPIDFDAMADLLAKVSELAARRPEIKEMDLNPVVAYPKGVTVLDARILLAKDGASAAPADPNRSRRLANLRRAFDARAVAVIGDKRMGGYMWLRAMKGFTGKLYSVQIDPNEIPGIEAMGVTNYKSLAEVPEPIDYAVSAVPRQVAPRILKDCADNKVASIGFFTSGFSETTEELGVRLERQLKEIALASEIALVGPARRRLLHLAERHPCDQFLVAGSDSRNQNQQGGVDRQCADDRGSGLPRFDGGRSGDAGDGDVYRGRARRTALLREPDAGGGALSNRGVEGRHDRGGRARDVFAYRLAGDAGGGMERDGASERSGERGRTRRDA